MSVLAPNCQVNWRQTSQIDNNHKKLSSGWCLFLVKSNGFGLDYRKISRKYRNRKGYSYSYSYSYRSEIKAQALWSDLSRPVSVEMEQIKDCDHLEQVLQQAREASQPIIIDWMANWCRKCIYLKPKLEKLAAEYDTKIKFYWVDVNNVPQALVKRGNISKMPTIQLWKDGEMKAEVIGGHKAWLVMDEVREMIQEFI